MTKPLHELTVAEASENIRLKRLSPVELVEALIARTDSLEPQIHAFITRTNELAMAQARRAEAEVTGNRWRGPLHGIPFAVKDIYDTAGVLTSAHSRLCIDRVPSRDAACVERLRDAGAVLLGKLATHEFAQGGPTFDLPWPPARNPWNTECFTGGSSSGSGAALAARLAPATLGSDTGGSIRGPASWCGVTGFMPTYGLVSRAGVIPNSFTFDRCGPMARTAEDCALLLQVLAGYDERDPGSVTCKIPDYRAALTEDLKGLRIGVLRHYWEQDQPTTSDVCDAMEGALAVFRQLGATVEEARLRPLTDSFDIKLIIAETEIFAIHLENLQQRPNDFGMDFLQRALPACLFSASDYVRATREHRLAAIDMTRIFDQFDVLVTVAQGPAPRLNDHDPLAFWKKPSRFKPSNVGGGPAVVVCNGFSATGLPIGMEIVGRPFGDAMVLRAAHAFQKSTDWHERSPVLVPGAEAPALIPISIPLEAPETDEKTRMLCDLMAERAGLCLDERQRFMIYRAAPYALEMADRLKSKHGFDDAPANVFQHHDAKRASKRSAGYGCNTRTRGR